MCPSETSRRLSTFHNTNSATRTMVTIEEGKNTTELHSGYLDANDTAHPTIERGLRRYLGIRYFSSRAAALRHEPPPDGGINAWFHVLLTHLVFFNTWGVSNSFGVFQQYFAASMMRDSSDISWIGGLQVFLLFMVGVFAGRASDAGYFHMIFEAGVIFQLTGIFTASLCTKYWQIILAQGVCLGIGNGLLFCPALSVLSTYFSTKRTIAIGISASGAALGGLIYPTIVGQMLPHVGYPWTVRIIGFVMLVAHIPPVLFFSPRVPPRKVGPIFSWQEFKDTQYLFAALSCFLNFWGLYFAFFYIENFARDRLNASSATSINLLITINVVGVVGRIVPSLIADLRLGTINVLIVCSFSASIVIYCWQAIDSINGLFVFAGIYGVVAGALQSLIPALAASLTTDLTKIGSRLGMILTIVSFGPLTGPSLAGALIKGDAGRYNHAQLFAGTSILVGAGCAVFVRISQTGLVLWKKA